MRKFDLNIERVLENWEPYHAVRELIANALDEQVLTNTDGIRIVRDRHGWHIRDFGRGLKYEHLTQNENDEKLRNPHLIGKFGVGLKDAVATCDRRGIKVTIKSRHCHITFGKSPKHGFDDTVTLHANVDAPSDKKFIGTEFTLKGCEDRDIKKAKSLFLKFAGSDILEQTKYGKVIARNRKDATASIYINGVKVSEEENFLFSYNITSLTTKLRKELNRERTNVGRAAYSESVKKILLTCKSQAVATRLVDDLNEYETGSIHAELQWTDVSAHACKLINASDKVLFLTSDEQRQRASIVDDAHKGDYKIVTIPDSVQRKIAGQADYSGQPIVDINEFTRALNDSFKFEFIDPKKLRPAERKIFGKTPRILALVGGRPRKLKDIRISRTMRKESTTFKEAEGLWEAKTGQIIIKRSNLKNLADYAGTLLHEVVHAKSGADDVSREFEEALTVLLGQISSAALGKIK
jgi:hypothetical protein